MTTDESSPAERASFDASNAHGLVVGDHATMYNIMNSPRLARKVTWPTLKPVLVPLMVVFGLAASLFTTGALGMGSKGDRVLGVLMLVLAVMIPVGGWLLDTRLHKEPGRRIWPEGRWPWAFIIASIVVFGTAAYGAWMVLHKTDDNVTDQVAIVEGEPMRDGFTAQVTLPIPQGRDWLALTLRLESRTSSGLCVEPAQLTLRPVVDGVAKQEYVTRSESEVRIHLGEVKRGARVDVTLAVPDNGCVLALKVDQAVIYNSFLG